MEGICIFLHVSEKKESHLWMLAVNETWTGSQKAGRGSQGLGETLQGSLAVWKVHGLAQTQNCSIFSVVALVTVVTGGVEPFCWSVIRQQRS